MRYSVVLLMLFGAALLEAGGDALMRLAVHGTTRGHRVAFLLAGMLVLAAYGYTVTAPSWDFGRLIGVYVAFFFVVAQLIAWLTFGQQPTLSLLAGGTLIIAGGYIVSRG